MMTNAATLISWALRRGMSQDMADTLTRDALAALAAAGFKIVPSGTAASERKGMEHAASICDRRETSWIDRSSEAAAKDHYAIAAARATTAQEAKDCARLIRSEADARYRNV